MINRYSTSPNYVSADSSRGYHTPQMRLAGGSPLKRYIDIDPVVRGEVRTAKTTTVATPSSIHASHPAMASLSQLHLDPQKKKNISAVQYTFQPLQLPAHMSAVGGLDIATRRQPETTSRRTGNAIRTSETIRHPEKIEPSKPLQRQQSRRKIDHRHQDRTKRGSPSSDAINISGTNFSLEIQSKTQTKGSSIAPSSSYRTTQKPTRRPRRRAVVVGVNYVFAPDILLRGSCNDAVVMALSLVNLCDFKPEDVILLIDSFPSACYRSPHLEERSDEGAEGVMVWKDRQPTRRNILLSLSWLRADTIPGDVLLFYFSGHGIQVDDMSGWEGEGYDEAILPMDFFGEEVNALTAVMIRNLLLSVCSDVQLSIILDCTGGQTMLDPAGTGGWSFIKGVKQKGVWPFITDATDKVSRATYDPSAWTDETMKRRGVRPRFVPGVDVSSTQDLLDPTLQRPTQQMGSKVKGFLFAAAPWGQVAIEAKMPAIAMFSISRHGELLINDPVTLQQGKNYAYHGVFSWSFLTSLNDLITSSAVKSGVKAVTYQQLLQAVDMNMRRCKVKDGGLTKLSQVPELTFYRAGGGNILKDLFLWPFGGQSRRASYSSGARTELPCIPHETRYLSPWEAEEQLHQAADLKRRNDPALRSLKRYCTGPQHQQNPYPGIMSTNNPMDALHKNLELDEHSMNRNGYTSQQSFSGFPATHIQMPIGGNSDQVPGYSQGQLSPHRQSVKTMTDSSVKKPTLNQLLNKTSDIVTNDGNDMQREQHVKGFYPGVRGAHRTTTLPQRTGPLGSTFSTGNPNGGNQRFPGTDSQQIDPRFSGARVMRNPFLATPGPSSDYNTGSPRSRVWPSFENIKVGESESPLRQLHATQGKQSRIHSEDKGTPRRYATSAANISSQPIRIIKQEQQNSSTIDNDAAQRRMRNMEHQSDSSNEVRKGTTDDSNSEEFDNRESMINPHHTVALLALSPVNLVGAYLDAGYENREFCKIGRKITTVVEDEDDHQSDESCKEAKTEPTTTATQGSDTITSSVAHFSISTNGTDSFEQSTISPMNKIDTNGNVNGSGHLGSRNIGSGNISLGNVGSHPTSGNVGSGNIGSGNIGLGNVSLGNVGSHPTSGNVGSGNIGSGNISLGNVGSHPTSGNVGSGNIGSGNIGLGNVSLGNVGSHPTSGNVGSGNIGSGNISLGNVGSHPTSGNVGSGNIGSGNIGLGNVSLGNVGSHPTSGNVGSDPGHRCFDSSQHEKIPAFQTSIEHARSYEFHPTQSRIIQSDRNCSNVVLTESPKTSRTCFRSTVGSSKLVDHIPHQLSPEYQQHSIHDHPLHGQSSTPSAKRSVSLPLDHKVKRVGCQNVIPPNQNEQHVARSLTMSPLQKGHLHSYSLKPKGPLSRSSLAISRTSSSGGGCFNGRSTSHTTATASPIPHHTNSPSRRLQFTNLPHSSVTHNMVNS